MYQFHCSYYSFLLLNIHAANAFVISPMNSKRINSSNLMTMPSVPPAPPAIDQILISSTETTHKSMKGNLLIMINMVFVQSWALGIVKLKRILLLIHANN